MVGDPNYIPSTNLFYIKNCLNAIDKIIGEFNSNRNSRGQYLDI